MKDVLLVLPYPPTANHTWMRSGRRVYLSKEYQKFIDAVSAEYKLRKEPLDAGDFYAVEIFVHPPDKRRRDLDNIVKPTLDALTRAGVWEDDCKVDAIRVVRDARARPAYIEVYVKSYQNEKG